MYDYFLKVEELFVKMEGCKMPWMTTTTSENVQKMSKSSICKSPKSLETMAKLMISSSGKSCLYDPCPINMTLADQACPKVQFCKRNLFDFKGLSMSLQNNFNHQIYPSDLLGLLMGINPLVRIFKSPY